MDQKIIKKTQETLGNFITKPPLTDKLLSKPPFRFLHDIITEVIRTTSFMKGLYTAEELDSKQITDKESKVNFLQKAIKCTSIVNGSSLSARPNKIVAGQEPEKTNQFLQAIARCLRKDLKSDEAVEQVLSGAETKPDPAAKPPRDKSERRSKTSVEEKDADPERRHKKERSREDGSRKHRSRDETKEQSATGEEDKEKRHRDKDREHKEKSRDREKSRHGERDKSRSRREGGERDKSKHREKSRHREGREEKSSRNREDKPEKSSSKQRANEEPEKENADKTEEDKEKERRDRKREERKKRHERKERAEKDEKKSTGADKENEKAEAAAAEDDEDPSNIRAQRPASAKGQRRRPQTRQGRTEAVSSEEKAAEEVAPVPVAPPSRKLIRPSSARPSAPRVRRNQPSAAEADIENATQEKAPIIVDRDQNMTLSDEEDAQFVVQEDKTIEDPELIPPSMMPENGELDSKEHGGLVRKILETKKELVGGDSKQPAKTEIQQSNLVSAQQQKEHQIVVKEIEQLRDSVQKLCQSSAPLAKLIDYSQEDMDAMQNELQMWRKENKQHDFKIKEDNNVTALSIEPLKVELQELEQAIAVYRTQMAATKANIIKNEEKIQKMMVAVATRS